MPSTRSTCRRGSRSCSESRSASASGGATEARCGRRLRRGGQDDPGLRSSPRGSGCRTSSATSSAKLGSDDYRKAVAEVVARDGWVFDGAAYYLDEVVYSRAQLVVALDYPRRVVMRRVVRRALRRPDPRSWRDPNRPARWAWSVWAQRRREIAQLERRPELSSARVVRLASPSAARRWLASLDEG